MQPTTTSDTSFFRPFYPYLLVLALFYMAGLLFLAVEGYHESFLLLNSLHFGLGDALMPHISNMGDSLILASILTLLIAKTRPALAMFGILVITVTGLFAQYLKRSFFSEWDRPLRVFEGSGNDIHYFAQEIARHNSFPSGHSVTIATGMIVLAAWAGSDRRWLQALAAVLVVLVGYSRIYVGLHFLGDVLAGVALGTFMTFLLLRFSLRPLEHWWQGVGAVKQQRTAFLLMLAAALGLTAGIAMRYKYLWAF